MPSYGYGKLPINETDAGATELLLCPSCGGKARVMVHLEPPEIQVECRCGAHSPKFSDDIDGQGDTKARQTWNSWAQRKETL